MVTKKTSVSSCFEDVLEYLSPIADLLLDYRYSEVMINPDLRVFVEENGIKREMPDRVLKLAHLTAAARRIARDDNTEINEDSPIVNARFGDGSSRVCIVMPPASPLGPAFSIRKFPLTTLTIEDLIRVGSLPASVWASLEKAITDRENILIAGATGSGKTVFLNACLRTVPATDRICTIEMPIEIRLDHANQLQLQATRAEDFPQLVQTALRLVPDRIVLGEVRGEEAFDLLRALNTGHRGSFATFHANGALESLYGLSRLANAAKPNLNAAFVREDTAHAIQYVVHIVRSSEGKRFVSELIRVEGYDSQTQQFITKTLYQYQKGTN
jgi:pilus assembly protein CpaF